MERVKIIGVSSALLCVAAVIGLALPSRSSSPTAETGSAPLRSYLPSGVPDRSGVAHEPADSGRATAVPGSEGSFLAKALSYVRGDAAATPTPRVARWTFVTVPVAETRSVHPERAERAKGNRARSTRTVDERQDEVPVADPDADWYAEPPADHSTITYAAANPGVPRGVPRMRRTPVRDAGDVDWYDSLDTRESEDPVVATTQEPSLADMLLDEFERPSAGRSASARASRSSRHPRASTPSRAPAARRAAAPAASHPEAEPVVACAATTTRYRLVKLVPAAEPVTEDVARAPRRDALPERGLPSPADQTGSPSVVLASLGPRLPGAGTAEYPGLAAPRPEPAPKRSAFCPLGFIEKKNKKERWCTRADKGGVSFREGPVAFLYPNGKKRAVGTYVSGTLQGPYVEYAATGKKTAEGVYKKGKKTGVWKFWWDNGKKQSEGTYVAGERTGLWTYYDEKGRKTSQGELRTVGKVEKKQGRWTFWHTSGKKSQEGTFRAGRKDGVWKSFDDNGRQLAVVVFRDGEEEFR